MANSTQFETPEVEDVGSVLQKVQQKLKQTMQKGVEQIRPLPWKQIGVPLNLNLTHQAEPFWQGYRELQLLEIHMNGSVVTIVGGSGAEDDDVEKGWFDEVRADTILISEMWSHVEKPNEVAAAGGKLSKNTIRSQKQYDNMEEAIHTRARALRSAALAFEQFLANRTRGIQELLRKEAVWQRGDKGKSSLAHSSGGLSMRDLEQLAPLLNRSTAANHTSAASIPSLALHDVASYNNSATGMELARTAESLMQELLLQHEVLFEPLERGGALHQLCRELLPEARRAQGHFIRKLAEAAKGSTAAALWRDGEREKKASLGSLEHAVCALDRKRIQMRMALEWLQGRFQTLQDGRYRTMAAVTDSKGQRRSVPELQVWVQGAVELLGAWTTVLMDVQEGLLISLRRREIAGAKRQQEEERQPLQPLGNSSVAAETFDYEQSWDDWKHRNCGGTSCYDKTTPITRFRNLIIQGKPLAFEAMDERDRLGWDVRVWNGIYDKACCENGTLAKTLKYGEKTPVFVVGENETTIHEKLS